MLASVRLLLQVSVVVLLSAALAVAGTLTVAGPGGVSLAIESDLPVTGADGLPTLRGQVAIAPLSEGLGDCPLLLYVDGRARGLCAQVGGELRLDTTTLPDGPHTVRVEAVRGETLIASTGSIAVQVANALATPAVQQAEALGGPASGFNKLYRARVFHEIIYFNNREADLERHAFIRGGRIYITLTDLIRHIGGTIIWGPEEGQVQVQRNGVTLRVLPNSATVYVDGVKRNLGCSTVRRGNRTFVPVRPLCALLGIATEWDFSADRAYVTYSE